MEDEVRLWFNLGWGVGQFGSGVNCSSPQTSSTPAATLLGCDGRVIRKTDWTRAALDLRANRKGRRGGAGSKIELSPQKVLAVTCK